MVKKLGRIFSDTACEEFIEYINKLPGKFIQDIRKDDFLIKYAPQLDNLKLLDFVTISKNRKSIQEHIDKDMKDGATHKLLIYLNKPTTGGGTYFISDNQTTTFPAETGMGILFDIKLKHGGIDFPKNEVKYTIGFRYAEEK